MADEFLFIAIAARDLSAADSILDAIGAEPAPCGPLDMVSIGRKASGEVRFHREPTLDRSDGPSWSAAAGLAAALYPSVGTDQPRSHTRQRALLAMVAGQTAAALGRSAMNEFHELLDTAPAAVIVAVPVGARAPSVGTPPEEAQRVTRTALLDVDALDRASRIGMGGGPDVHADRGDLSP